MTKRELLNAEKTKTFGEICVLVARELGYGELPALSDKKRAKVEKEARRYIKKWEETISMRTTILSKKSAEAVGTRTTIRSITPLRWLLNQYQDICERILDEHDIEAGLWAYKKRQRSALGTMR
jgi:hypothetical protein